MGGLPTATFFRMKRLIALAGISLLFGAVGVMGASASPEQRAASAAAAAAWIADQQLPNGTFFGEPDPPAPPNVGGDGGTAHALIAAIAGGVEAGTIDAALEYIETNGESAATHAAFTGRIIAALVAAGADPTDFGGFDYVELLEDQYDETSGQYTDANGAPYGGNIFPNLLAAIGQIAADGELPGEAVDWIVGQQCDVDPNAGAFGFNRCEFGHDVDTTAYAVSVLANSGDSSSSVQSALDAARSFLLDVQNEDGGFPFCTVEASSFCDGLSSTDSTGLALSAIAAFGDDAEAGDWIVNNNDPVAWLLDQQNTDGSFQPTTSFGSVELATLNATPGMAGQPYPVLGGPDPDPDPNDPEDDDGENDDGSEEDAVDSDDDGGGDGSDVAGTTRTPRITLPDTGTDAEAGAVLPAVAMALGAGLLSIGSLSRPR